MASKSRKSRVVDNLKRRHLHFQAIEKKKLCSPILGYLSREPAIFCFLLSLFLIALTLITLGVYVRGKDHIPDLDAMKNWNAYIGKLSSKDYCFYHSAHYNNSFQGIFLKSNNGTIFKGSNDSCAELEVEMRDQTNDSKSGPYYGTIDIGFTYFVRKQYVEEFSPGVLYSKFTGKDVGTKIKDSLSGKRIDEKISILVWINLNNINYTERCTESMCNITGCLLITAPLSAIPTRMPQIYGNFSAKILKSGIRSPHACNCEIFSEQIYRIHEHKIKDCNKSSTFEIHKSPSRSKAYGIIRIELSEDDRIKASKHMFLASLTLLLLAMAVCTSILFKKREVVK